MFIVGVGGFVHVVWDHVVLRSPSSLSSCCSTFVSLCGSIFALAYFLQQFAAMRFYGFWLIVISNPPTLTAVLLWLLSLLHMFNIIVAHCYRLCYMYLMNSYVGYSYINRYSCQQFFKYLMSLLHIFTSYVSHSYRLCYI